MSSSASKNQGIQILASFEDRAIPLDTPVDLDPSGKGILVGDWMGSTYDANGRRVDFSFFFDNDGRYERTVRREPDFELRDSGKWDYRQAENLLRMEPEIPDDSNKKEYRGWRVLSVNGCEESNVLLVLREVILASRNLPILFYRVHDKDRGYGTGRKKQFIAPNGLSDHNGEAQAMNDPIVEEVRRIRDAHAARFNYDLDAIFQDIKEREKKSGLQFIQGVARQPESSQALQPTGSASSVSSDSALPEATLAT